MGIKKLMLELHQIGCIQFGDFRLKSGKQSPVYFDLRLVISYPKLLQEIAELLWGKVGNLPFQRLCGVPYTALFFAAALSLRYQVPLVMKRKEVKEYGTKKVIEGVFHPGETCLVVEDLVTSGGSVLETVGPLESVGLKVADIVVIMDREQGARAALEEKGYHLHALFTMGELLTVLEQERRISREKAEEVRRWLAA